jgi:hypothetical protein
MELSLKKYNMYYQIIYNYISAIILDVEVYDYDPMYQ